MKITFIGHASILVESKDIRILSDPWWNGPCFGAQWWLYPKPHLDAVNNREIDYIYISHGHHDHFHPATLKTFSRTTKVLVAKDSDLCTAVKEMGFRVIEVREDEERQLNNGVKCRILKTGGDDSLIAISDGAETCLNLNDALHSSPVAIQDKFVAVIKKFCPHVTYLFCGYGIASHFPNCYIIPGKDRAMTAARRQSYFNHSWAKIVYDLAPTFAFPFAADVVFLEEELSWANEPVHNSERPTDVFKAKYSNPATMVADIAPGFVVDSGGVLVNSTRPRISNEALRSAFHESIRKVNRYRQVDALAVEEVAVVLRENIKKAYGYFSSYQGNYKCLIRFRNSSQELVISKRGSEIAVEVKPGSSCFQDICDLTYTTRLQYLKRSLTTTYGYETLFVGSGGLFEYTDASRIDSNVHRELICMLRKIDKSPMRSVGGSRKILSKTKSVIKTLMGRSASDLYDLREWTVFASVLSDRRKSSVPNRSIPTGGPS